MNRKFCDQCAAEMTADNIPKSGTNGGRLEASLGHLKVEVITMQNNVSNTGDYCTHCILDALYLLDSRPAKNCNEQQVDETAYLVESRTSPPTWLVQDGDKWRLYWTKDANEATKFTSRELAAAAGYSHGIENSNNWLVTEHMFVSNAAAPVAPSGAREDAQC